MFNLKSLLPKSHSSTNFLVVSISFDHIKAAVFDKASGHLEGVGRSPIDGSLTLALNNALEALGAVVEKLPKETIMGIQSSTLMGVEKNMQIKREEPAKKITFEEVDSNVRSHLQNVEGGKLFFSTIAHAEIDKVSVPNPIGVAGHTLELQTFNGFISDQELSEIDKGVAEANLDVVKVVPTSFAMGKMLAKKLDPNFMFFYMNGHNTEITRVHKDVIEAIATIGISSQEEMWSEAVGFLIQSFKKVSPDEVHPPKSYHNIYVWGEEHLEHARNELEGLNWKETGEEKPERFEVLTLKKLELETELDLAALKEEMLATS